MALFRSDLLKSNSKRKLPIGDNMSEEAKWKVKNSLALVDLQGWGLCAGWSKIYFS